MNRVTPIILAVAMFMEMMDATVIATSLPAIAADINADPIALKLAMTSYLVALAIFIPVSGWMADRFGAKNVFRWAIFVFVVGSVACAIANSLPTFVGARFLQGMGGSLMTPLARLVLVRATPKNQLVSAMAWFTIPALVGPVAGPPIGGFLTTFFSWHWIFLINVPIGIIGIIAATLFLPKVEPGELHRLDTVGLTLTGTGFAGVIFGLSVISLPALPPIIGAICVLVGTVALIAYVFYARRTEYPVLDLTLLKDPLFCTALVGGTVLRIGVGAVPFLLPLMLQLGFGLSPFQTGLITMFGFTGAFAAKFFAQQTFKAYGFPMLLVVGAIFSAVTLALKGFLTPDIPVALIIILLVVGGIFRSLFMTGNNAMTFANIAPDNVGQATALSTVSVHISFALGVALAGGVLELMRGHEAELTLDDFHIAFFVTAAVSILAFIPFLFLPKDAGANVSGHRPR